MVRYYFAAYLMVILATVAHAGDIDGVIYQSGQELEGVSVTYLVQAAKTDAKGQFVLENVPSGELLLIVRHPDGMQIKQVQVFVLSNQRTLFTFDFSEEVLTLGELVVYGTPVIQDTSSKKTLKVSEILRVTGAANDPLRALQILPGITPPNNILAGLNVRGGGPGDNTYYFDRVSLFYPYHFIGLSTTINSAAIDSVDVYAGGFGAEFGNAQAVIDIKASPPERKRLSLTSNLNLLASELLLESPVGSKGAFYVAGRRSYADLIIPRVIDIPELTKFPRFWDYQAGFDYDITPEQQLHFVAFSTEDAFEIVITEDFADEDDEDGIDPELLGGSKYSTGFNAQSLTLNSSFSERFTLQSTFSRREYYTNTTVGSGKYFFVEEPGFYTLREDAEYDIHPRHKVQFGGLFETGNYSITSFFPRPFTDEEFAERAGREALGEDFDGPFSDFSERAIIESDTSDRFTFVEAYLQDRVKLADWLSLKMGFRTNYFNLTDQVVLDPRASLTYQLPNGAKLRAAWGIYHQNPTPAQILPEWGNPDVQATKAIHYVLELERDILGRDGSIKLAGYYKDLRNLVTKHPTDVYRNQGTGNAQGVEMLLKYTPSQRFLGWLSYTYSISNRKDTPDALERLYIFDQPHVATLSISYNPTTNWSLGLRWNYASGIPIAPSDEDIALLREPANHRMDLRFSRTFRIRQYPLEFYLDVLNAYGYSGNVSTTTEEQKSIEFEEEDFVLPIIPYLGISTKF